MPAQCRKCNDTLQVNVLLCITAVEHAKRTNTFCKICIRWQPHFLIHSKDKTSKLIILDNIATHLVGMCRIAKLPDTEYPAKLIYRISSIQPDIRCVYPGESQIVAPSQKYYFDGFCLHYRFARLASHETIA